MPAFVSFFPMNYRRDVSPRCPGAVSQQSVIRLVLRSGGTGLLFSFICANCSRAPGGNRGRTHHLHTPVGPPWRSDAPLTAHGAWHDLPTGPTGGGAGAGARRRTRSRIDREREGHAVLRLHSGDSSVRVARAASRNLDRRAGV